MTNKSKDALVSFLDYLGTKGLMNAATAASRKAAVNRVMSILSPDESQDVTALDLDAVMSRFHHLEGAKYTPTSLAVYKGRVSNSIEDFERYQRDPLNFKPATPAAPRRPEQKPAVSAAAVQSRPQSAPSEAPPAAVNIIPIPIRPDLTIKIQGLPYDLTTAEAAKIANVIRAMAAD